MTLITLSDHDWPLLPVGTCVYIISQCLCIPVVNLHKLLTPMHCLFPRNHFVYTAGTSCSRNPWLPALSKVNMKHSSLPYFSKCTVDIFLASLSISLPTHILQKMHKDNNSKNTTMHLRRWLCHHATFAFSSYYLDYFFILSYCGWLSHMHTSKLQYNNISHLKKNRVLLCNSMRKLQTSLDQHLSSKILITNPVTQFTPATQFSYDHTLVIHCTSSY